MRSPDYLEAVAARLEAAGALDAADETRALSRTCARLAARFSEQLESLWDAAMEDSPSLLLDALEEWRASTALGDVLYPNEHLAELFLTRPLGLFIDPRRLTEDSLVIWRQLPLGMVTKLSVTMDPADPTQSKVTVRFHASLGPAGRDSHPELDDETRQRVAARIADMRAAGIDADYDAPAAPPIDDKAALRLLAARDQF